MVMPRRLVRLEWEASKRESFVEDIQAMRRRVLENVPESLRTRELKLGVGGLRDVEFAVQLLQLVHGRSDESLRTLATVDALEALVQAGYVGRDDGDQLIEAYEFLRLLEHRLQLERFRRTHTMPPEDDKDTLELAGERLRFYGAGFEFGVDDDEQASEEDSACESPSCTRACSTARC